MSAEKNELGPSWNTGGEARRVLRYCYNSTRLYGQLRDHSSKMTNACPLLFYDQTCEAMGRKWSDGVQYPNDIKVGVSLSAF